MMGDPFSLAAGSFAVVGLVDVVLRTSVECCRFLRALKDAPAEIGMLRTNIQENQALVEAFKMHLKRIPRHVRSPIPSTMDEALKLFDSSVRLLDRELCTLKTLKARYNSKSQTWTAIKFHLDDRKVNRCLTNLENAKSALCTALMLVEGERAALRQKSIDNSIKQGLQQVTTATKKLHINLVSAQKSQGRLIRFEHAETRSMVKESQRSIIDALDTKFPNLRTGLGLSNPDNQEVYFVGIGQEALLKLLFVMQSSVQKANVMAIAQSLDSGWLQEEFDTLLQSAITKAAALHCHSTALSSEKNDRWIASSRCSTAPESHRTLCAHFPSDVLYPDDCAKGGVQSVNILSNKWARVRCKTIMHPSSVGQLYLNVPDLSAIKAGQHRFREARLLFIPALDICTTSLGMHFIQQTVQGRKASVHTHINAFQLIQSPERHLDILANSTLENIDDAIRSGIISPYDQIPTGWMIFFRIAGKFFRSDLLRYLDMQGISISSVNGENDILSGVWGSIQIADLDTRSEQALYEILRYIDETSAYYMPVPNTALMHAYYGFPVTEVTKRRLRMIKTMLTFLKRRGYDLNAVYVNGRTPFLDHMLSPGGASLTIARTLLELGADPHAVDCDGANAMQLALVSNTVWNHDYAPPVLQASNQSTDTLLGKLDLLIQAGVDLHHNDSEGDDSYSYAKICNFWDVWCEALKQAGKMVDNHLDNPAQDSL